MAGTPMQIILQYIADMKSFMRGSATFQSELKKQIDSSRRTKDAIDQQTRSAEKLAGAYKKVEDAAKKADAAEKKLDRGTRPSNPKQPSYRNLATGESSIINSAWRSDSRMIDKRYLHSISGLREAYFRLNKEASKTLVIKNGMRMALDDIGARSDLNRMKLNLLARTLDNMSTNMINLGKNTQWTGRQLMVGITTPVMAVGGLSVRSAMSIAQLDLQLRKVMGTASQADFSELDNQTRELSERFGIARAELKAVQTEFARVGFDVKTIRDATRQTQELVNVGDVDIEPAQELIRVLYQVGMGYEEVQDQLEKFNVIDDKTNLSLRKTIATLKEVYPTARRYGVSASEAAALTAGITEGGFEAGEAARTLNLALTKIPTALANMQTGASGGRARLKDLQDQLENLNREAGLDLSLFDDNGNLRKGTDLLIGFAAAVDRMQRSGNENKIAGATKAMRAAFGVERMAEGSQFVDAVARGINEGKGDLLKAMRIAQDEVGAQAQEWARQLGAVEADEATQVAANIQKIINAGQDLGKKLLPYVVKFLEFVNRIIDGFKNMSEGAQNAILAIAGAFAALGPIVYTAGMGIVAFGTVFKGLIAPLKSFFGIKGRFNDMFEGAEEALMVFREELNQTGDFEEFGRKISEVMDAASRGALTQKAAASATDQQAASSARAAASLNAQAAAQERLNAANSKPLTRSQSIAHNILPRRPVGSSGIMPPDTGDLYAGARQKALNELSGDALESLMYSDQILGAGVSRLSWDGQNYLVDNTKGLENLFGLMAGRTMEQHYSDIARKSASLNDVDLKDLAKRRAEVMASIETATEAAMIAKAKSELEYLGEAQKRIKSFESVFGRRAPVSTIEEFNLFEKELQSVLSSNKSLQATIQGAVKRKDFSILDELFEDVMEGVRFSQGSALMNAFGLDTSGLTLGTNKSVIPVMEGVLPRSGKGSKTMSNMGLGKAVKYLADVRDSLAESDSVPLPITSQFFEEFNDLVKLGPDLEMLNVREKEIAETLIDGFRKIAESGGLDIVHGLADDFDTSGYVRESVKEIVNSIPFGKKLAQGEALMAAFGLSTEGYDTFASIYEDKMYRGAHDVYLKTLSKLRTKFKDQLDELKKPSKRTGKPRADNLRKLETVEKSFRKEARKAVESYLDSVSGGSVSALRRQGGSGSGGMLDADDFAIKDRRKALSESKKGIMDRVLKVTPDESYLDKLGFSDKLLEQPIRVNERFPERAAYTLARRQEKRRKEFFDSLNSGLMQGLSEGGFKQYIQEHGIPEQYRSAVTAAVWGRADEDEITELLRKALGEAFTQEDKVATYALASLVNEAIPGSRQADTSGFFNKARETLGAVALKDSVKIDPSPAMLRVSKKDEVKTLVNFNRAISRAEEDIKQYDEQLKELRGRLSKARGERNKLGSRLKKLEQEWADEENALVSALFTEAEALGLETEEQISRKTHSVKKRMERNPGLKLIESKREALVAQQDILTAEIRALNRRQSEILNFRNKMKELRAKDPMHQEDFLFKRRGHKKSIAELGDILGIDREMADELGMSLSDMINMAEAELARQESELKGARLKIKRRMSKRDSLDQALEELMHEREMQRRRALGADTKFAPLVDKEEQLIEARARHNRQLTELKTRISVSDKQKKHLSEQVDSVASRRDRALFSKHRMEKALASGGRTSDAKDLDALRAVFTTQRRGPAGHFVGGPNLDVLIGGLSQEWAEVVSEISVKQVENVNEARRIIMSKFPEMGAKMADDAAVLARDVGRAMRANIDDVDRLFGKALGDQLRLIAVESSDVDSTQIIRSRADMARAARRSSRSSSEGMKEAAAAVLGDVYMGDDGTSSSGMRVRRAMINPNWDMMSQFQKDSGTDPAELVTNIQKSVRLTDEVAEKISAAELSIVEAEKTRNRKLINARRRALRALKKEAAAAQKMLDEANAELDAFRKGMGENAVFVRKEDGRFEIFPSTDAYIEQRQKEAIEIASSSSRLEELTQKNIDAEIAAVAREVELWERAENEMRELQAKRIGDRADRNVQLINRRERRRSMLAGRKFTPLDQGSSDWLAAMHAMDAASGLKARNYSRDDIRRNQLAMANMFNVMGSFTGANANFDPSVLAPRRTMVDRAKGAASALGAAARHPVKAGKELAVATKSIFQKVPKGTILDAATWLNPLRPMRAFNSAISKTFTSGAGAKGLMAVFGPGAGGGMASVLAASGPVLLVLGAIAAVTGVLALNFKKWYDTAKPGIDALKEAGQKLINAVLEPIRGLFSRLNKEGEDGGGIGSMWENIGKIIGKAAEMLSKIIDALTPIVSFVTEVLVAAFYHFIQSIRFIVAVFTGDWEDALDALKNMWENLWYVLKLVVGTAAKGIMSIVFDMIGGILAAIETIIPSSIGGFEGSKLPTVLGFEGPKLPSWSGVEIPGLKEVDGLVKDARKGLNNVNNNWSDAIDRWIGEGFKDAGKKAKGAGEDMNEGVNDGLNTKPLSAPEISPEEAQQSVNNFISAFQNQLRKVVDGWKEAAMSAFNDWAEARVEAVDKQVEAIDKEIKAERQRDQDLDYLRKKEELRNRRRGESLRYQADRDLAIYEGRYDDAKQLDYEYGKTLEDLAREERDLEEDRQRTLTERARDSKRERLEIQKQEIQESNNLRREQLQKQLDMMTEYIPRNVAEAERMQKEIQAKMAEYTDGYGTIGQNQAAAWGANWSTAFKNAQTQIAHEAYWAGEEAMKQFASALGIDPSLVVQGPGAPAKSAAGAQYSAGAAQNMWNKQQTVGDKAAGGVHNTWNKATKWHTGGTVGNTAMGPRDVQATLQTGEYVIQRSAVRKIGTGFLDKLNRGEIGKPTFHTGGFVGAAGAAMSGAFSKAVELWKAGKTGLKLQGGKNFSAEQYKNALASAYGGFGMAGGGAWTSGGDISGKSIAQIVDNIVKGIHPEFRRRLEQWNASLGNKFDISRGYRSMAQQAYLYDRWIRRVPGQAMAAPPGKSMHNFGLAVDLLPARTTAAERAAGAKFGLRWPMSFEPWHVEPVEAKSWRDQILRGMVPIGSSLDTGGLQLLGGGTGTLGGTVEEIKAIVRGMLPRFGWGLDQWNALDRLVQGESSWNPNAANPTSSARGLFQKMTSIHGPVEPTVEGQAMWGLNYIKSRYGSPTAAYAKWLSRNPHWYHEGGPVFNIPRFHTGNALIKKTGLAEVAKGERILRPEQGSGGDIKFEFNFEGGFFGSDREIEKLVDTIETRIAPKLSRARGMENRKISTVVKK